MSENCVHINFRSQTPFQPSLESWLKEPNHLWIFTIPSDSGSLSAQSKKAYHHPAPSKMSDQIDPLERLWGWPHQTGGGIHAANNLSVLYEHLPANEQIRFRRTPKKIFRFLKRDYADDFLTLGKLRVRALARYKDDVPFSRKDLRESEMAHWVGQANLHRWIACCAYGLCFSTHPSQRLSIKFDPVCVEIRDVVGFGIVLDSLIRRELKALGHPVNASYGDLVFYYEERLPLSTQFGYPHPQVFLKPTVGFDEQKRANLFAVEREYRFMWDLGIHDRSRFLPSEKPPELPDLFIQSRELCNFIKERPASKLCPDSKRPDFRYASYTIEMHEKWIREQLSKQAPS